MADQSDQSDIKPWTIKGIPPEARNAAIAAAEREDQTIGEWISRAIRQTIQADRQADRAPVPLEQPQVRPSDPAADLGAIERMVAMAMQVSTMTGKPPPRNVSSLTYRLLRDRLKALDGPTEGGGKSD